MKSKARIGAPKAQIEAFCRRYGIKRLSLFGSVLRDEFGPASDIDVLVEFELGQKVGRSEWRISRTSSHNYWGARRIYARQAI